MNQVAEITVQKIWEPFATAKPWRDGKRRGKVVSAEGTAYQVAETMLREFSEGEVCKVEFKEFGDKANPGKEVIKKIWNGSPQPNQVPKVIARPRMDPSDARGAFITVVLCAFVRAGKVPLNKDAIATAREEIGYGYDQSHNPQRRDDMKDEIPNWGPQSENPAD